MLLSKFDAVNGAVFYAAGVFHYFITQQIRDMVVAMADTFYGVKGNNAVWPLSVAALLDCIILLYVHDSIYLMSMVVL